ncbi:hypothetical protein RCL1_008504 [Eukaryota sp. TZLM3-RCL]
MPQELSDSCTLCSSKFSLDKSKLPYLLDCFHSICFNCVSHIRPNPFKCTDCETITETTSLPPRNALYIYLLRRYGVISTEINQQTKCEYAHCLSKKSGADVFCESCNSFFCEDCYVLLHSEYPFSDHLIRSASSAVPYPPCPIHSGSIPTLCSLFCVSCFTIICPKCVKSHYEHDLLSLDEAPKHLIKSISRLIREAMVKSRKLDEVNASLSVEIEKIDKQKEVIINQIDDVFDSLLNCLQSRRDHLKTIVQSKLSEKRSKITSALNQSVDILDSLSLPITLASKLIDISSESCAHSLAENASLFRKNLGQISRVPVPRMPQLSITEVLFDSRKLNSLSEQLDGVGVVKERDPLISDYGKSLLLSSSSELIDLAPITSSFGQNSTFMTLSNRLIMPDLSFSTGLLSLGTAYLVSFNGFLFTFNNKQFKMIDFSRDDVIRVKKIVTISCDSYDYKIILTDSQSVYYWSVDPRHDLSHLDTTDFLIEDITSSATDLFLITTSGDVLSYQFKGKRRFSLIKLSRDQKSKMIASGNNHLLVTSLDDPRKAHYYDDILNLRQPVELTFDCPIKMIACGFLHSLILLTNGSVFAFGQNSSGCLGLGTRKHYSEPVEISSLSNFVISKVFAGGYSSYFLTDSNSLFVAGSRFDVRGKEEEETSTLPVKMKEKLNQIVDVIVDHRSVLIIGD